MRRLSLSALWLVLLVALVGCQKTFLTVYAPFRGGRFPARHDVKAVERIPGLYRDPSRYFVETLRRKRAEFFPLGTLYCVGRGCDAEWRSVAARFGAGFVHVRCGVADERGFESPKIVSGPLFSRRLPKLRLTPGNYGCTGVPFVDLLRRPQVRLDPQMVILVSVLLGHRGWRESILWSHQKHRELFSPGWFLEASTLVAQVVGASRQLELLQAGLIQSRGDRSIAATLEALRMVHEARRAVIREAGLHWVWRVLRVSSESSRPGEEAKRVIGPPALQIGLGYYKRAWTSITKKRPVESIDVQFRQAVRGDGIRVVETNVPIQIARIYLRDPRGAWQLVWSGGTFRKPSFAGRVQLIRFSPARFASDAMRIELRGYSPFDRVEVEAIALHAVSEPR